MGPARPYAETAPTAPKAAAVYTRWTPDPGQGVDGSALDTSCGGVYFLDGSPKLRMSTNFSVWTRFQPLDADSTKTEIVLGRMGAWLICRKQGRLAAGVANQSASAGAAALDDVFAGDGPLLETGKWYDIGLSVAEE